MFFMTAECCVFFFFFSSRRRHTRLQDDWSSDVCSSDLFLPSFLVISVVDFYFHRGSQDHLTLSMTPPGSRIIQAKALPTPATTALRTDCGSRSAVGIEDEEQQRESGQYPEPGLQLVRPSSNQLADGIKHETRAESDGDVEGEGHQADHRERGDGFGVVGKIDARDGRKHEQAGNDECRPVGLRRNGRYKRREEERQQETTSSNEDGKPGAPARLDSGGRLEVSAGGGGTQNRSDAG